MFATILSPSETSEGLLVVREHLAGLPGLMKQGRFAPTNVRLVAQLEGERHQDFVSRVLTRILTPAHASEPMRAAIVSLRAGGVSAELRESRKQLLVGIAARLVHGPDSELVIMAPPNTSAAERVELFELLETTLHSVSSRNVRLAFGTEERRQRHAPRQNAMTQAI